MCTHMNELNFLDFRNFLHVACVATCTSRKENYLQFIVHHTTLEGYTCKPPTHFLQNIMDFLDFSCTPLILDTCSLPEKDGHCEHGGIAVSKNAISFLSFFQGRK